jgi:hypothetical protein
VILCDFVSLWLKKLKGIPGAEECDATEVQGSYKSWQHNNIIPSPSLAMLPNDVHILPRVPQHLQGPNYRERSLENQPAYDAATRP